MGAAWKTFTSFQNAAPLPSDLGFLINVMAQFLYWLPIDQIYISVNKYNY